MSTDSTTTTTTPYELHINEVRDNSWELIWYESGNYISTLSGLLILSSYNKEFTKNLFNIRKWSKRYVVISQIFNVNKSTAINSATTASVDSIIKHIKDKNIEFPNTNTTIVGEKEVVLPKFITIQDDGHIKLELSTDTNDVFCVLKDGTSFPCNEDWFATMMSKKINANTFVKKVKQVEDEGVKIGLGDTVLLWWPTGTGKTFRFHDKVNQMIKDGEIDYAEKITVTDGFEDTDFLAYISPKAEWGISIIERSIVTMLREASNGKRVAICIDELNRWSRSLMNLVLTFIDSIDWDNYVLNNFVADERIVIPRANLLVYATINLGWRYSGINSMDEALKDRFSFNFYVGYNLENEKELLNWYFGNVADKVETAIKEIRELYTEWTIGSSISTRGLKSWGEVYSRMPVKTPKTLFKSFMDTLMFKLTSPDDYWVYSSLEEASILQVLKPLI